MPGILTKTAGSYNNIVGMQVKAGGVYSAAQGVYAKVAGLYAPVLNAVVAGGIKSITIVDATPIDPVSSVGINGSGWIAIVVLKGLTSLVGAAVAGALTVTVSDPGYDTSGNATTVNRTITGSGQVRRQYNNGNSKLISTDGTDLTLYISLDDWIYAGTTIVSASIGSTFYTGCVASSSPVKTNLSVTAYTKPLFTWMNMQNERASGGTQYVEGIPAHRHARAGQMVPCIKYYVTDGTNQSADVLVNTPVLSTLQLQGNIPEVFPAIIDMSAQTQGGMSRVIPKVYPWIGDASAVLDLSVDGYAWPTSLPLTPLRVFCDRTGGYGGGFAYVDGTGGGTPQVSATAATAKANPYASISAAAAAMATWNNANRGHNNYGGGTIRLMDNAGSAKTHTISAGFANTPGLTHLVVEKDPASPAVITITWGGQVQMAPMTLWRNLTVLVAPGVTSSYAFLGYNAARDTFYIDNCIFDNTQNQTTLLWYSLTYWRNISFTGGNQFATSDTNTAMLIGCVSLSNGSRPGNAYSAKTTIGNSMPLYQVTLDGQSGDGDHGKFTYNNRVNAIYLNNPAVNTIAYGVASIQNLAEANAIAAAIHHFADGDRTTILNLIDMHNTGVGERCSRMYNDLVADKVAPSGVLKIGTSKYCIWDNYNIKTDYFNGGQGSVGNFAYEYSVGNVGNVSLFGMVNRGSVEAPTNDGTDNYLGNIWLTSSEYNLFRTALGLTQAQIMAMFTSYTAAPQGAPALGGNYKPLSTAANLKGRVPVGFSVLGKDISGAVRRTDGTGAAGAYEY